MQAGEQTAQWVTWNHFSFVGDPNLYRDRTGGYGTGSETDSAKLAGR